MNQFRLDLDATRCAQAHQDAHCGKMLCELMQQACTAFPEPRSIHRRKSSLYRGVRARHQIAQPWVGSTWRGPRLKVSRDRATCASSDPPEWF